LGRSAKAAAAYGQVIGEIGVPGDATARICIGSADAAAANAGSCNGKPSISCVSTVATAASCAGSHVEGNASACAGYADGAKAGYNAYAVVAFSSDATLSAIAARAAAGKAAATNAAISRIICDARAGQR
jgi:hypothetical protein